MRAGYGIFQGCEPANGDEHDPDRVRALVLFDNHGRSQDLSWEKGEFDRARPAHFYRSYFDCAQLLGHAVLSNLAKLRSQIRSDTL